MGSTAGKGRFSHVMGVLPIYMSLLYTQGRNRSGKVNRDGDPRGILPSHGGYFRNYEDP